MAGRAISPLLKMKGEEAIAMACAAFCIPTSITIVRLTEALNLDAAQGQNAKLPIIWSAYMSGLLSGSTDTNVELATKAVSQAFAQSPYLTNK